MLVVPVGVFAEIVGDGEEPCGDVAVFQIAVSCLIHSQEHVVGVVGSQHLIAAQLTEEETLQASDVSTVEFLKCRLAASAHTEHQLLVGHLTV